MDNIKKLNVNLLIIHQNLANGSLILKEDIFKHKLKMHNGRHPNKWGNNKPKK